MRFIQRDPALAPPILGSPDLKAAVKRIRTSIDQGEQVRNALYQLQSSMRSTLQPALNEQFLHKCAYCESSLGGARGAVDWFRPIFGAAREDGRVDQHHYHWLIAQWDNIHLSCPTCNNYKSNHFPVNFQAGYGMSINQLRRKKEAKLLDPCHDRPEKHFLVDTNARLLAISAEGAITIDMFHLNRMDLLQAREARLQQFLFAWNAACAPGSTKTRLLMSHLASLLRADTPYVGTLYLCLWQVSPPATRKILRQMMGGALKPIELKRLLADLGPIQDEDLLRPLRNARTTTVPDTTAPEPFHKIRHIQIRNFKGIEALTIEFPESSTFAFIGENATGKTSVLQAIALGLAGYRHARALVGEPTDLLADQADSGEIVVRFWDTDEYNEVSFSRNATRFSGRTRVQPKVFGYGPYRLLAKREQGKSRRDAKIRLLSLFDDTCLLNGHHGWLGGLNPNQKNDLAEVLQLLLASADSKVTVNTTTLAITTNGRPHPIDSLSSGMQSVTALCTDLMEALYESAESVLEDGYVIIIDELDAHLHPSWRIGIVDRLSKAFPQAQVIFSTHDPLTLRGLEAEQVRILYRDENGGLQQRASTYADSQSIDQVLTSNAFGMPSTHPPEWEREFADYIALLRKEDSAELSAAEMSQLKALELRLNRHRMLGETRREQLMLAVIEQLLASERQEIDAWDEDIVKELAEQVQASLAGDAGDTRD